MAKIRYTQDKEGVIYYPITHERAVRDNNGTTLETKLGQKQDVLIDGETIKTINYQSILGSGNINITGGGTAGCEFVANKVTTIEPSNTDVQYPSAKAVYDYIEGIGSVIGDIDSVINNIEN